MWKIYDDLIKGIPKELLVDEVICGKEYCAVRSGNSVGMSASRTPTSRTAIFTKNMIGAPLVEVAECIKSWNFVESATGLAAINTYYNSPQIARGNGVSFSDGMRVEDRIFDPFIMSQNEVRGKKVAVVGHFPHLERLLEPICDFSIIEWTPKEGDFPISAAEYILPECEYVYVSNACLVHKTLPRLLELSQNAARITMVGPGTPLAPVLFEYGFATLSGFMIKDHLRMLRIIAGAENVKIYVTGQKVAYHRGDANDVKGEGQK